MDRSGENGIVLTSSKNIEAGTLRGIWRQDLVRDPELPQTGA
jgi:hypothetical protein